MSEARAAEALTSLRARIDSIDAALVDLLAERFRVVEEVVVVKRREGLPARLEGRVEDVVAHVRGLAQDRGCPPELAERLWRSMIDWIIDFEDNRRSEPHRDEPE